MLILRSALFYIGYVSASVAMSSLFIVLFPLMGERGRTLFAVAWCRAIVNWLRLCCGVTFEVYGAENLPRRPIVVLANHQSSWETIFLYQLVYPVSPILKKELLDIPFWGWAMRLQKPIAIDRSRPREAGKSLLRQGAERLQQGSSVVVFPEGTRRRVGSLRRFSRGGAKLALAAGSDVLFIAHNAGQCWPPRAFIKHPGKISVVISEPVATAGHSADSLTDQAEHWIREQLEAMR